MSQENKRTTDSASPWWREKFMWLVWGGPGVVVIASFVTLFLALHFPETVLDESKVQTTYVGKASKEADPASLAPAMKGRNHAATGAQ
ncbi:hypothetical protein [Roseateles sp. PN1]|uniref:hypothetical protein n=1 Tax=Roseateles sp. PN1 TaxID=3137372 RepID=UPI0031396B5B